MTVTLPLPNTHHLKHGTRRLCRVQHASTRQRRMLSRGHGTTVLISFPLLTMMTYPEVVTTIRRLAPRYRVRVQHRQLELQPLRRLRPQAAQTLLPQRHPSTSMIPTQDLMILTRMIQTPTITAEAEAEVAVTMMTMMIARGGRSERNCMLLTLTFRILCSRLDISAQRDAAGNPFFTQGNDSDDDGFQDQNVTATFTFNG